MSPREEIAAKYVALGWPNRRISEQMGVKLRTVERYVGNVIAALGVNDMAMFNGRVMIATFINAQNQIPEHEAGSRCGGHELCNRAFIYCDVDVAWEIEDAS